MYGAALTARRLRLGIAAEPPAKMGEYCELVEYWLTERKCVQETGQCSKRCDAVELIQLLDGQMVCPHTFLACSVQAKNAEPS